MSLPSRSAVFFSCCASYRVPKRRGSVQGPSYPSITASSQARRQPQLSALLPPFLPAPMSPLAMRPCSVHTVGPVGRPAAVVGCRPARFVSPNPIPRLVRAAAATEGEGRVQAWFPRGGRVLRTSQRGRPRHGAVAADCRPPAPPSVSVWEMHLLSCRLLAPHRQDEGGATGPAHHAL